MGAFELDWATRRPHPALRTLVSRYVGYRQHGVTLPVHYGLPSGHVTFVVSLEQPVRASHAGRGRPRRRAVAGLRPGLHAGPALIAQDDVQAGVQLDLDPHLGRRPRWAGPGGGCAARLARPGQGDGHS